MDIEGLRIIDIKAIVSEFNSNRYDEVYVYLSNGVFMSILVDIDTDELLIKLQSEFDTSKGEKMILPLWANLVIGKQIVSFWKTKNSFNCFDLFILGLDLFEPNFAFYCLGSEIIVNVGDILNCRRK